MTRQLFNMHHVHPSWIKCLKPGLQQMDHHYLAKLNQPGQWLPGPDKLFNAFTLPLEKVNYVLFGESPYPRPESANGFAFWDAAVKELWSPTGLSKKVNRATSLRNIIKMLLVAAGYLSPEETNQEAIAKIPKDTLVQTNEALFQNFLNHGFLLLNATPVLQEKNPHADARAWRPFIKSMLDCLIENRPQVQFILFGRIANEIDPLLKNNHNEKLYSEHPYNISFITNKKVLDFFRPLDLLKK